MICNSSFLLVKTQNTNAQMQGEITLTVMTKMLYDSTTKKITSNLPLRFLSLNILFDVSL